MFTPSMHVSGCCCGAVLVPAAGVFLFEVRV